MDLNENLSPKFFKNGSEFRSWLEENHKNQSAVWVGFYKKKTGKESIDWPGSVDQALCYGWIDGIRKSIDDESYKIRFTPRNARSHWSNVNLKRIKELKKLGLVTEAGLKVYQSRKKDVSGLASYEQGELSFPKEFEKEFKKSAEAYSFFRTKAPSYQKQCGWWIMSAKKEETRQKRFQILVNSSAKKELAPPFKFTKKK